MESERAVRAEGEKGRKRVETTVRERGDMDMGTECTTRHLQNDLEYA